MSSYPDWQVKFLLYCRFTTTTTTTTTTKTSFGKFLKEFFVDEKTERNISSSWNGSARKGKRPSLQSAKCRWNGVAKGLCNWQKGKNGGRHWKTEWHNNIPTKDDGEKKTKREREKENDDSVTTFGDISPTFKSLLQFFRFYFVFGKMLNLFWKNILVKFL